MTVADGPVEGDLEYFEGEDLDAHGWDMKVNTTPSEITSW